MGGRSMQRVLHCGGGKHGAISATVGRGRAFAAQRDFESVTVRLLRNWGAQCSSGWLRIASEQECIGELWLAMNAEKLRQQFDERFHRRNPGVQDGHAAGA